MADALILAAGRGARLRPLTDSLPKPLITVGGETLIDRHLRVLAASGVQRVVINLGWLGEQIAAHVGDGDRHNLKVVYSPEGYPTLDTGGAIVRALDRINTDTFWVINADIWTDYVPRIEHARLGASLQASIGLVDTPAYRDDGDFAMHEGRAVNRAPERLTFAGIAAYHKSFFRGLPDGRFSVVPILRNAANEGRLGAFHLTARWFDVGTPRRLESVRDTVSE